MPIVDTHLLNKIRSVKALRDKGATDGERDAAQQRLVVLLAKHKLTEQDIPPDSFSSRGRSYTPPPRRRPRTSAAEADEWAKGWERTMREFHEAAYAQSRGQQQSHRPPPHRTEHGVKKKPPGQMRFEKAFGRPISTQAWHYVKLHQTKAQKKYKPSNPNAFSRAFYEYAAASLRGRIYGAHAFRSKTSNPEGQSAGQHFGENASLSMFTNAS